MRALNIDVYWPNFKQGGIIDGRSLESINIDTLAVSAIHTCIYTCVYLCLSVCVSVCVIVLQSIGISDEIHQQIIIECLDELCRPTPVNVLSHVHVYIHV